MSADEKSVHEIELEAEQELIAAEQTTEEHDKVIDDIAMVVESVTYSAEVLGGRNEIQGWDDFSIEELAPMLQDLEGAVKRLGDAKNGIAERVAKLMDKKHMVVAGVALEKGDPTGSVTWNWPSLIPELVARASDERNIDRETGEALESEVNAVVRVLTDCVAFSYARVGKIEEGTGLKARGLDPDDYRTKPTGPRRAKVISK